jgi:hypothetical protein
MEAVRSSEESVSFYQIARSCIRDDMAPKVVEVCLEVEPLCACSSCWQRRGTSPSQCACLADYLRLPRHLWTDEEVRDVSRSALSLMWDILYSLSCDSTNEIRWFLIFFILFLSAASCCVYLYWLFRVPSIATDILIYYILFPLHNYYMFLLRKHVDIDVLPSFGLWLVPEVCLSQSFFFWGGGVRIHYYWGHYWPIAPAPDDEWWLVWSSRWNEWQGELKYSEKTCPSATLSTTNPTRPDPGLEPGPELWHGSCIP